MRDPWLYHGDNLVMMKSMKEKTIDLIYIDPPYNSKRNYKDSNGNVCFSDIWTDYAEFNEERKEISALNPAVDDFIKYLSKHSTDKSFQYYLTHIALRLHYMRVLLKDTGSIYLHCDPTASHYIKLVMDRVFGVKNFRNEVVWGYSGANNGSKEFPKKHDIILFYAKDIHSSYFNGLDVLVKSRTTARYYLDEEGKQYTKKNGKIYYRKNQEGKIPEDYWVDINMLHHIAKERLGYPTQKPEALLERIIKASSNEGDVVADFYLGSGTTAAVCKKLNRLFIGSDISSEAVNITRKRVG